MSTTKRHSFKMTEIVFEGYLQGKLFYAESSKHLELTTGGWGVEVYTTVTFNRNLDREWRNMDRQMGLV